jgi:hypothetical protein
MKVIRACSSLAITLAILAPRARRRHRNDDPEELAGRQFSFKTFDIEINKKMNIVSFACLDSSHSIDILPLQGIVSWVAEEYGVTVDVSDFERLRDSGKLRVKVATDEKKGQTVQLASEEMAVDGTSVGGLAGLGLMGLLQGTSFAAVNWSEYREPVKTMDFRYKLERGKNDQFPSVRLPGSIGSYIAVILRVRDGEPDEKGYYKLRAGAERRVKVDFRKGQSDTEVLEQTIRALPALLAASSR